jgi:ribosomal-protein-alanine N-acetyltransferase
MEIMLETPRLILRKKEITDAPTMLALNSDQLVTQYTGDGPFESLQAAESIVEVVISQYEKYGFGRWAVQLKDTEEVIGWCGLKYHPETDMVDIGYRLFAKHWGKGYATEAASHSVKYGFDKLNIQRIIGNAMKANISSIRVFEKIGMKFLKETNLHCENGVVYEIFKPDTL